MDGKQLTMASNNKNNNRGYHYGGSQLSNYSQLFSESSLDAIIQANKVNSIEFIDSDGCPTDASIMGPLVKMDPSGQRILAPFDAFKFPTSDLVFFRAVVSSCVSECKPVLCGANGQSLSSTTIVDSNLINTDSTALIDLLASSSTSTPPLLAVSDSTTTELPPRTAASQTTPAPTTTSPFFTQTSPSGVGHMMTSPYAQQQQQQQQTAILTRWVNNTLMDFLNEANRNKTRQQQQTTPLPFQFPKQQQANSGAGSSSLDGEQRFSNENSRTTSGDLLTTVPGFTTQRPANIAWPEVGQNNSLAANNFNNLLEQQGASFLNDSALQNNNMVNFTNNHQVGKIPAKPASFAQHFNADKTITTLPPINLDSLSAQQKQHLVKLFESKLKQQILSSPPQPVATTTTTATNANLTSNEANNNNYPGLSELADLYTGFLTSVLINSEQQKIRQQQMKDKQQQHLSPSGASIFDDIDDNLYKRQLPEVLFNNNYLNNSSYSPLVDELDLFKQDQLNKSAQRIVDERMLSILRLLEQKLKLNSVANKMNLVDLNEAAGSEESSSLSMIKQSPRQNRTTSSNDKANLKAINNNLNVNKSKSKQQQAFADSYLGAFHSFGRRRRRKRGASKSDDLTPSYVVYFNEQPAHTNANQEYPVFTQAVVELYHTTRPDLSSSPTSGGVTLERFKRQSDKNANYHEATQQQPSYEMDELVVQSIKIVDRLQFHEDEQQQSSPKSVVNNKINRNKQARSGALLPRGINSTTKQKPLLVQNGRHDEDDILLSNEEDNNFIELDKQSSARLIGWSSSGAIYLIVLALSFIFIQIILVVFYFLDSNRKQAARLRANELKRQLQRREFLTRQNGLIYNNKDNHQNNSIDCSSSIGLTSSSEPIYNCNKSITSVETLSSSSSNYDYQFLLSSRPPIFDYINRARKNNYLWNNIGADNLDHITANTTGTNWSQQQQQQYSPKLIDHNKNISHQQHCTACLPPKKRL